MQDEENYSTTLHCEIVQTVINMGYCTSRTILKLCSPGRTDDIAMVFENII